MKLAAALLGLCILPSSAWAADHQMKIGEVMLSHEGMANRQFIEIQDNAPEPFPKTYGVQLHDAGGTSLGLITLTLQANVQRYTIATTQAATALGFTADQILEIALPTNGQACFRRLSDVVENIHCLSWGTVSSPVSGTFGTDSGPTPPDGQSLQRVASIYGLGDPTPGAANAVMFMDGPIVDGPPPDAAVTPDGSRPDGGGGGNNSGDDDDGCSVGGGATWFGMALLAMLAVIGRAARRRA